MRCWVMVMDQRCAKLDPKAEEHIFTGVAQTAKAQRYYNTVSKQVQLSCNITFDESDTKLYPIPDEEDDETASLKGENQTSDDE